MTNSEAQVARLEAIAVLWGYAQQVESEFCCGPGDDEADALYDGFYRALGDLGVTNHEMKTWHLRRGTA